MCPAIVPAVMDSKDDGITERTLGTSFSTWFTNPSQPRSITEVCVLRKTKTKVLGGMGN